MVQASPSRWPRLANASHLRRWQRRVYRLGAAERGPVLPLARGGRRSARDAGPVWVANRTPLILLLRNAAGHTGYGGTVDHLFVVDGAAATAVAATGLIPEGLLEVAHLQEWVIAHPAVLGQSVMVVTAQYDRWTDEVSGTPIRRRLDVLGLDTAGRLVVAELKRGKADQAVLAQVATYASLVRHFTPETLGGAHADFLTRRGTTTTPQEGRRLLEAHLLEDEWDQALLGRPRQVVVAEDFPPLLRHTVEAMTQDGAEIHLVRVNLRRVREDLVAAFTRVWPTVGGPEFTPRPAGAKGAGVTRKAQKKLDPTVSTLIASEALPEGTRLKLVWGHRATHAVREAITRWIGQDPDRAVVTWSNTNASRPLRWRDGQQYSPTGLAKVFYTQGRAGSKVSLWGTTWWAVDTAHVPAGIDPQVWSQLGGKDLRTLAGSFSPQRRDWTSLHTLLKRLPEGHWTTYGDLAAVMDTHQIAIGSHLAACTAGCSHQWRVLTANGTVSPGFRWHEPARPQTPAQILADEGVKFTGPVADPRQRLGRGRLQQLLTADKPTGPDHS